MNCSGGNNSQQAVAQAYARWRAPLLRFLQRRLGSRCDAEDVAQESFARFAAVAQPPDVDKQGSYIYRIAVNLMRDEGRRQRAQPARANGFLDVDDEEVQHAVAAEGESCAVLVGHRQRLARLEAALQEMPERQREAFVLHRFDGLTQSEVAERMGISRRMTVKHLSRALAYCELRVQFSSVAQMRQHRCDIGKRVA